MRSELRRLSVFGDDNPSDYNKHLRNDHVRQPRNRNYGMELSEVFWNGVTQPVGDLYERCFFRPLNQDSVCPDFEFSVTVEDGRTSTAINRVVIVTRIDEGVRRHIRSHPLWSKDCRPFILMNIQELMWSLKLLRTEFGNPSKKEIGFSFKQGGILYFDITAEVFVDFGGSHIVQLINYANTHVLDQLKAVYEDHPAATPSDQYVETFKQNFFREQRNKKIEEKRKQKLRLKTRQRKQVKPVPNSVFVDESGDIGFQSTGQPYIINAYVVPSVATTALRQELTGIIAKHWSANPPRELHFNKVPESKIVGVIADIAKSFQSYPGTCICYLGEKGGFLSYLLRCEAENRKLLEKPIITNWAYTLNESSSVAGRAMLILFLEEVLTQIAVETVDLQSPMEIYHDRKHRNWMNEALEIGFRRSDAAIDSYSLEAYGKRLPLFRKFKVIDSSAEPCLWVSDWICWELSNWVKGQKWSNEFESCLGKIQFITFNDLGKKILIEKPSGRVIGDFPDWPREVGSI